MLLTAHMQGNERGAEDQQGHFVCLAKFEATGSEIELKFEYNMFAENCASEDGASARLVLGLTFRCGR